MKVDEIPIGKAENLKDKVLFIDARNYFTVVDRTLNEWSDWQLKNLNAIVWLYRGEIDNYTTLIEEYHKALDSEDSFADCLQKLTEKEEKLKSEAKKVVEESERKNKKKVQAEYDQRFKELSELITTAKEAVWLYEKFGEGEYKDIPGLCKISDITEIESKNWSLTPGAYVGVPSAEDDGVDFHERMKEIHEELLKLQEESNALMVTISNSLKEIE